MKDFWTVATPTIAALVGFALGRWSRLLDRRHERKNARAAFSITSLHNHQYRMENIGLAEALNVSLKSNEQELPAHWDVLGVGESVSFILGLMPFSALTVTWTSHRGKAEEQRVAIL